jgi:hypothetical protein
MIIKSKKLKVKRQKFNSKVKSFSFCLVLFASTFYLFTFCYAQAVSSSELINNAKQYDAKTVVYSGEVIGDVMARGEFVWINANDGVNAIGIWAAKSLAKDIFYTGSYKSRGDVIEAEGVFHRACLEHGGDLDIHAVLLRKIKNGGPAREIIDPVKKNLAISFLGVLCLVWILSRLKRK